MHYYTYAYLREDRTPYYIGKGTGKRIYSKNRTIKLPKDKSRIIYLKQNLTEKEAFKHEIYMIAVFGRKDLGTGILYNMTDGGEGISNPSDEIRKKLSEAKKGKILSEEHRRKISEAGKGHTVSEETKRNIGEANKNPSEETRRKIGAANKGKTRSEETKRKISDANKNPSEETRRKLSEAKKGKILTEEHKIKLSEVKKGIKWWNDGCGNCKMMVECPNDNWKPGRK